MIKAHKINVLFYLLLICFIFFIGCQKNNQKDNIIGKVQYKGEPVKNVILIIRFEKKDSPILREEKIQVVTGENGQYSASLPLGKYKFLGYAISIDQSVNAIPKPDKYTTIFNVIEPIVIEYKDDIIYLPSLKISDRFNINFPPDGYITNEKDLRFEWPHIKEAKYYALTVNRVMKNYEKKDESVKNSYFVSANYKKQVPVFTTSTLFSEMCDPGTPLFFDSGDYQWYISAYYRVNELICESMVGKFKVK